MVLIVVINTHFTVLRNIFNNYYEKIANIFRIINVFVFIIQVTPTLKFILKVK